MFAADVKLGRTVYRVSGGCITGIGGQGAKRFAHSFRLCVSAEPFPSAFAPKAAFAYAAKAAGCVHHVRAVDPDDAADKLGGDV